MSLLTQAAAVSAVVIFVYFAIDAVSRRQRQRGAKTIPGPKEFPILGSAGELAKTKGLLIPLFNGWADKYGPIMQFSVLGQKQVVLSTDKAVNDLFVKRGNIYSGRGVPTAIRYMVRDINPALMPKNDVWRRERKLIHSAMAITSNEKYQPFMIAESTKTLNALLADPGDFDNHFCRYSYGVLGRSLLGLPVASVADDFVTRNERASNEGLNAFRPDTYICNLFPPLLHLPGWLIPSNARLQRITDQTYDECMLLRADLQRQMREGTALESVYRHYLENEDKYGLSVDEAAYTFGSMIGGGARSPHNALLGFLGLWMRYPEWQRRLQEHVDEVVGKDRLPSFDDIPRLPLVRAVVKESIRYRSIVAEIGIPHKLEEDDYYEGYFFEKGTILHANYSKILMDPETYPDQQPFNPARWVDPSYPTYREPLTTYPNLQGFTSFGYGRRACPGYDFAERTLVIMAARLAWAFDVLPPLKEGGGAGERMSAAEVPALEYEPTPNPKPLPFRCDIRPRGEDRARVVAAEAAKLGEGA